VVFKSRFVPFLAHLEPVHILKQVNAKPQIFLFIKPVHILKQVNAKPQIFLFIKKEYIPRT
jgi:hypothetical protein